MDHQQPLTLKPTANMPAWTIDVGFWRRGRYEDQELYDMLSALIDNNDERMTLLQRALDRELPTEDGHTLARALVWLDAQLVFTHKLKDDADALLDVAENHFKLPAGASELCVDDEGKLVPSDNKGWSVDADALSEEERKKFRPRWNALTTNDREVDCAAKCVAFRRLRNEYVAVLKGLESKLYKASGLLDELRARHRAANVVERPR